jgi:hypothetical protein
LGYGDWRTINGNDDHQWYTTNFGGTSSASPIVAGAAASLQGFRKSRSLPVLTPVQMCDVLRSTGTPQAASPRQIGPQPNLRAAIAAHGVAQSPLPPVLAMSVTAQSTSAYSAPNGFRDYIFYADAGNGCEFSTCNNASFNTVIELFSPSNQLIASHITDCQLSPHLSFIAPSTGYYKVRVRGTAASYGSFTMTYRAWLAQANMHL